MARGPLVEKLERWRKYYAGAGWEKAFGALERVTAETPDGVIKVQDDDLRIIVMSYETRPADEAAIEAHEEFADIQMLLSGRELFRWGPAAGLWIKVPHDPAKDVAFYHAEGPLAEFAAEPGYFAVFLPGDAHSTQIRPRGVNSPQPCRKAVVKVRMKLIDRE